MTELSSVIKNCAEASVSSTIPDAAAACSPARPTPASWLTSMHPPIPQRQPSSHHRMREACCRHQLADIHRPDAPLDRYSTAAVSGGTYPGDRPCRPVPRLCLPDNFADIDADERGWRIGHVAELAKGRLRRPGVFFGVEEPEGMLDDVIPVAARPVATRRADHAPQYRNARLTDHGKCLIHPVRLDLDPSKRALTHTVSMSP